MLGLVTDFGVKRAGIWMDLLPEGLRACARTTGTASPKNVISLYIFIQRVPIVVGRSSRYQSVCLNQSIYVLKLVNSPAKAEMSTRDL
jgi:hypothetical protein